MIFRRESRVHIHIHVQAPELTEAFKRALERHTHQIGTFMAQQADEMHAKLDALAKSQAESFAQIQATMDRAAAALNDRDATIALLQQELDESRRGANTLTPDELAALEAKLLTIQANQDRLDLAVVAVPIPPPPPPEGRPPGPPR